MPVKIRLSRQGRKHIPFYHIVATDSRAPRDGKYIERLGMYNPKTNPATIEINFDRALYWLQSGAQLTETCRNIFSDKGLMLKKHLLKGIKKEALTEEQAEVKFQTWLTEKEQKKQEEIETLKKGKDQAIQQRLEAETKVKEAKAAAVAKKTAEISETPAAEDKTPEAPVAESGATEEAIN
jgi:small subunit ribosomal protein S16